MHNPDEKSWPEAAPRPVSLPARLAALAPLAVYAAPSGPEAPAANSAAAPLALLVSRTLLLLKFSTDRKGSNTFYFRQGNEGANRTEGEVREQVRAGGQVDGRR